MADQLTAATLASGDPVSDQALVERARGGDLTAFELLMRRHNQRVYRVVRSVLRESAELEDVMQQAYLSAFVHLPEFQGAARWSTWVCRIALNEALGRLRQRGRFVSLEATSEDGMPESWKPWTVDPERAAEGRELRGVLEQAVERLPEIYRSVLVMREVEGMSTAETAAVLGVTEEVVKTRLHRARAAVRADLDGHVGEELRDAYSFGNERCDRVVAAVLARLKT
jgi:RNA polymerase sigma-70 factor (ECF subfamily)